MSNLTRFSVSMETSLCKRLDALIRRSRYKNRSEFLRDMIRDYLVKEEWKGRREAVGTITLVYDHHARGLAHRLNELQHHHHSNVMASTHVHLDHDTCVEVIILKGRAGALREMADLLRQQKGVLHGALSISSTGKGLR
ncbi:MAG: nickel-responsive transcriptional regulator NikR [Planctomycetota bacterium]|jgi:CopG family nickel-responsive transcriptional regulator